MGSSTFQMLLLILLSSLFGGASECLAHNVGCRDADTLILAKLQPRPYEIRRADAVGVRVPTGEIAEVHSVSIPVRGSKGSSFVARIYGNERDASVPNAQFDLCPPVRVYLEHEGSQVVTAHFEKKAVTAGIQFFVVADSVIGGVVFPSNSTARVPDCICSTEDYGRQVAKIDGQWRTSRYEYPWSIAYTARSTEDEVKFRVDTLLEYPREHAQMHAQVHVGDVTGNGHADIITRHAILSSDGRGTYNVVAWPENVVRPGSVLTIASEAESDRPLVVVASPGNGSARFHTAMTASRKENVRILSYEVPTKGNLRALLPLPISFPVSHGIQSANPPSQHLHGETWQPVYLCAVVETPKHQDARQGAIDLVLSAIGPTSIVGPHETVSAPVAGVIRGVYAAHDDSSQTTTLSLVVANADGMHVVRASISAENISWTTTSMISDSLFDAPGVGIGRIGSVTTVSAVPADAIAPSVLIGIEQVSDQFGLSLERAVNSDRRSSFIPLQLGTERALVLFTSDSCRPVHLAVPRIDQSGNSVWMRMPACGIEVLAGSIDGTCVPSSSTRQADAIVVEKPGVVLIAQPIAPARVVALPDPLPSMVKENPATSRVLLRGTGLAQRTVKQLTTKDQCVSDGGRSTLPAAGVRVSVLGTNSSAESHFVVDCPDSDELLEVQVLSLDGRILHQWNGATVLTQRKFVWAAATTVPSGTYVVRAIAKRSNHVSSFQRVQ